VSDLIIAGDYLVHDACQPIRQRWGVLVRGDRVGAVGPVDELCATHPNAELFLAAGRAVAPGLVNAHHHMYGVLAHGIPLDKAPAGFWPFLRDFWWPMVEDALDQQMITAATELACLQMVEGGVTGFYDCLEAPGALPGALDVEAEVVRRWGLRGVLSFEATERAGEAVAERALAESAGFIDRCRVAGGLVHAMMCFHTTFTCSAAYIRRAVGLAQERNVSVHMHLSEGLYEPEWCLGHHGVRPVAYYDQLGVLGPWTLASQCVQVDAAEIDLLASRGCRVSHMPMSNCEVGGGIAPAAEMIDKGIPLGLGTDGYVSDFLENMRWAFLVHKARLRDPGVMPARAVWKAATSGGARAVGLEGVGVLAEGSVADLILVDLDLPTSPTTGNLLDQMLLWRDARHVTDVMVAGKWLKRNGEALGADAPAIRAHCREAAARLWRGR
jgi:cytosine/adenosine deaminase-related metal-dependent hydrolase